jgi:hypothetical protein
VAELSVTNIKPSDIKNLEELLKKFTEGILANQPEDPPDLSDEQKLIIYEYRFVRRFQEGSPKPDAEGLGPISAPGTATRGHELEIKALRGLANTIAVLFGDVVTIPKSISKDPAGDPAGKDVVTVDVPMSATSGQLAVLTSEERVATRYIVII